MMKTRTNVLKTTCRLAVTTLYIGSVLVLTGCSFTGGARRTAYINTNPPGAQCRVNGVYYGTTPVEMPYLWNWYYEVKLDKPGYQSKTDMQYFKPAFYNRIPFDIITETLPIRTFECKRLNYDLVPGK